MELIDILYQAIAADAEIVSLTGGRIYDTCIPVPPDQEDKTPLPYIIITDGGYVNETGTKDNIWEGDEDSVKASVLISASTQAAVRSIRRKVRQAIADYVANTDLGTYVYLTSANNDGVQWDWMKPCYFDAIHYQCDIDVQTEESQS